jgi:LytS/YehU family sensor histidine kinase
MGEIAFNVGVVIGSLLAGVIFGLIPLILGLRKKKKTLAISGFVACIVGSLILGLFLSIPICIVFVILILGLKGKN